MEEKQKAILAGLCTGRDRQQYEASMKELEELAAACGLAVADCFIQFAPSVTQKTLFGSGKVEEIRTWIEHYDADIVVVNESLTPMQVRNLEDAWDTEVLDRTGIILQIFSTRARTREARLQVESARLRYMLPRLAGLRKNLSRQGGGSGRLSNKGAGEEKLELDRRHIEHRIEELDRQLEAVEKERKTQRSRRESSGLCRVALTGYTNAGKSTLMNRLLEFAAQEDSSSEVRGKQVFEKDMLFATLDTSVRKIKAQGHHAFLLSDTVGFISDLPHSLVKAFRSTLDEVRFADLLLEIVDVSDPDYERQISVTAHTLEEIGAGTVPVIYVLNKADRLEDVSLPKINGERIWMSAKTGEGLDELLSMIDEAIAADWKEEEMVVPYRKGALLHELGEKYPIEKLEYLPDGIRIRAVMSPADLKRLKE